MRTDFESVAVCFDLPNAMPTDSRPHPGPFIGAVSRGPTPADKSRG